MVYDLEFRVYILGVQGLGLRVFGLRSLQYRVKVLGFRV